MPTVREAAFAVFEHFGVDKLFGNPGSTEIPMLRALPFPYVMGLNEAVVVAMADGYARASGKPALVNLHSAAGTGHSLGNLFTAFRNCAPVVVTAGPAGALDPAVRSVSLQRTRGRIPAVRTSSIRSSRRAPRTSRWR